MHGTALKTTGGLRRTDLKYNKQGKIVSRLLSTKAKQEKRLERAGWTVRKGEFGAVQMKGGGKFLLGDVTKFKGKTSNTYLKKHLTPIPEKLISELDDNDYYRAYNGRLNNVFYSVNHYGVVNILEKVYDYYKLGGIPEDLTTKSTRQLIMYLGESPTTFKNKIQGEWGTKLESGLGNLKDYINIANENTNSNIRGVRIDSNKYNYSEQTLWKLALYKLERENERNASTIVKSKKPIPKRSPSPNKNSIKMNTPPDLLGRLSLGQRPKRSPRLNSAFKKVAKKVAKNAAAKAKEKKVIANARKRGKAKGKEAAERLRNKRVKQQQKKLQNPGWGNENVGYKTKN